MTTPRQIETELETAGLPAVVFKSEAAKKIGVSVELLYKEIARGNIPRPADKGIIERAAIARWLAENPRHYARFLNREKSA